MKLKNEVAKHDLELWLTPKNMPPAANFFYFDVFLIPDTEMYNRSDYITDYTKVIVIDYVIVIGKKIT